MTDLAIALAAVALAAGYAAAVKWWPYAACRRCRGTGKLRSPGGRHWRACTRCTGSGRRLRTGRRLVNAFTGATRDARD